MSSKPNHKAAPTQLVGIAKTWATRNLPGWSDEAHRDLLRRHGAKLGTHGKPSASTLSPLQIGRVLAEYERRGWPRQQRPLPGKAAQRPVVAKSPEATKVRALWLMLHELGEVRDPSEKALQGFVKRMTGIDAIQWASHAGHLHKVIEALKDWALRKLPEVVWPLWDTLPRDVRLNLLEEVDQAIRRLQKARADGHTALFDPYQSLYSALRQAHAESKPPGAKRP